MTRVYAWEPIRVVRSTPLALTGPPVAENIDHTAKPDSPSLVIGGLLPLERGRVSLDRDVVADVFARLPGTVIVLAEV